MTYTDNPKAIVDRHYRRVQGMRVAMFCYPKYLTGYLVIQPGNPRSRGDTP